MVKHTQKIRLNCLSMFDYFVELALKKLIVEGKFGEDPLKDLVCNTVLHEIFIFLQFFFRGNIRRCPNFP